MSTAGCRVPKEKPMKQLKVSLPDDLRGQLDSAAAANDRSLGNEIRERLQQSFEREAGDTETLKLAEAILKFATLVLIQTGHTWHAHRAANRVMRCAITNRLARLRPKDSEPFPRFRPGELPVHRLVAPDSDDPDVMGYAIEATEFHTPPMTPEMRKHLDRLYAEDMARLGAEAAEAANDIGKKGDDDEQT
jgi:plasmid stability protein